MSRTNRILASVSALLLLVLVLSSALASYEYLIDPEDIVVEVANYHTTEVQKSTFIKSGTTSASEYYPIRYSLRYEGANARFVEFKVRRGAEVKKGDILAELRIDRDEVLLSQRQLTLARAKEDYAAGILSRQEAIEEKQKEINAATDLYEREKKRLEREKLLVSLEKYCYETENSIADHEKALNELMESYAGQYVVAPVDGVISDTVYFRENQLVRNGTVMIQMYDPSYMLFEVKDENNNLRYNMEVTVTVGPGKNRYTGAGRVIACPFSLPGEPGSNRAYIRVEKFDTDEVIKNYARPSVSYNAIELDNMYVVDKKAVTLFGGRHFVYKLSENGMVSKRYVNHVGGTAVTGTLLLQGVSVGEKLILD